MGINVKDKYFQMVDFSLPQNICDHFRKFLSLPKTSIRARVLGKRVNRGADCGLEIRVRFIFQGHVKGIA